VQGLRTLKQEIDTIRLTTFRQIDISTEAGEQGFVNVSIDTFTEAV